MGNTSRNSSVAAESNKAESIARYSDEELAAEIHRDSLSTGTWNQESLDKLIARSVSEDPSVARSATRAFFQDVVERNCDLFDTAATRTYVKVFSQVVAQLLPRYSATDMIARYERVRRVRRYEGEPKRVGVLSRVTLGADVSVTSVLLNAAKARFPQSEICFVGPAKNAELFVGDPRILPMTAAYKRSGLLRDRLLASEAIREFVDKPDTLVIDPDSRLTQLGLIPVCPEENYLFFESRAYGKESNASLSVLAAQWAGECLGVNGSRPYSAPPQHIPLGDITASLGVGENNEKWPGSHIEKAAISQLALLGRRLVIDRGAGGEESDRVDRLFHELEEPKNVTLHNGSFGAFAGQILQSRMYFGYDSAGQHVAAAGGVPLVAVFAGYAAERTFQRWWPVGNAPIEVVKSKSISEGDPVDRLRAAITSVAEAAGLSSADQ